MIEDITKNNMGYKIAAPGDHRLNFSERANKTFKNRFVSILHGCYPWYISNHWGILIKQAVITLNMVQPSIINPKLSAYN